jgi:hypothetical protein
MAARWNAAPPGRYQDKLGPVVDRGAALSSIGTYTGVAFAAGLAGRYGCEGRGAGRDLPLGPARGGGGRLALRRLRPPAGAWLQPLPYGSI